MRVENFTLQSGEVLPYVNIVYKTYGKLNRAGDNCILLPTSFTGTHVAYARLIGRARPLNPAKYFIVVPNSFGNGVSSSPSNMVAPFHGPEFPDITIADNVRLQHQLLTEKLMVKQIALIYGWSMGATQGFAWAASYPEMVRRLLAVCGLARCWPLNDVVLQGAIRAITTDANFRGGNYSLTPETGMRAFGQYFAAWGYSATFYREQLYHDLGFETAEAFIKFGENYYLSLDANDVVATLRTWKNANMELEELKKITAATIIMPCDHDMYVTLDEARIEAAQITNAELRPICSPYGHIAGAPGYLSAETIFLEQAVRDLLAR